MDSSLEFELEDDSSNDLTNEEFEFSSSLVVLSDTKALDLINKFRKDADAYYVEAKRSTVSSIAQIPYWMYGVLVVLGWNEAMAVLFNPLYFTFLLFALASAYVVLPPTRQSSGADSSSLNSFRYMIVQLGLTGPLLQVTKTVAGEVRCALPPFCSVWGADVMEWNVGSATGGREAQGSACDASRSPARTAEHDYGEPL